MWGLKSLHDSAVISFITPQHTPNQTWMLTILQPVCRFSLHRLELGEGQRKQQRNANSSGGVLISIVVAGPQVEQIQHARAGKRRWREG